MEYIKSSNIDIEKRLLAESEEKGIKIGEEKLMIKFVESMIKNNYSKKEILKISKINETQFNQIQKNLNN